MQKYVPLKGVQRLQLKHGMVCLKASNSYQRGSQALIAVRGLSLSDDHLRLLGKKIPLYVVEEMAALL